MVINSISPYAPVPAVSTTATREATSDRVTTEGQPPAPAQETVDEQVVAQPIEAEGSLDTGRAKGMLRLLQEGHFKGVADLRHRIKFHEEIAALENQQAAAIAAEGLDSAIDTLTGRIEELAGFEALTPEQTDALSQAASDFSESAATMIADLGSTGAGESIAQIRSSFEELSGTLTAALTVAAEETDESETAPDQSAETALDTNAATVIAETPVDPVVPDADEPTSVSAEQMLADIVAEFMNALDQMEEKIQTISVLPEISEPSGQGKAFEKFLAIYENLRTPTADAAPGEQQESQVVDILL